MKTCLSGLYPSLCDHGLLDSTERTQVAAAERRENLKTCLSGSYPSLCNQGLLDGTEPTQTTSEGQSFTSVPTFPAVPVPAIGKPNANDAPKTVYVNGYLRKDGTYVPGYYRSAPNTNPPKVTVRKP